MPGTKSGTVSFGTNDTDEGVFTFDITGHVLNAPTVEVRGNDVVDGLGDADAALDGDGDAARVRDAVECGDDGGGAANWATP